MSWDGDRKVAEELAKAPILTDLSGKHWSLGSLERSGIRFITIAPGKDLKADRLQQNKQAIVFDEQMLTQRFRPLGFQKALERLIPYKPAQGHIYLVYEAEQLLLRLKPFEELASSIVDDHHPLNDKELSKPAEISLRAIRSFQGQLSEALTSVLGQTFAKRSIYAMRSETAEAYTDGVSMIYFRTDFLSSIHYGPVRGVAWSCKVISLLVHEYLHDFNSGLGHTHDAEFYETFHRAMQHFLIAGCVDRLFSTYVGFLKRLPKSVVRQLDHEARLQDRLGKAPEEPLETIE